MKPRFLFQIVALLLVLALVTSLTLGILGKISLFVFWAVAAATVGVSFVLHRSNPT